ncbi:cubilin [Thomomys bottae]
MKFSSKTFWFSLLDLGLVWILSSCMPFFGTRPRITAERGHLVFLTGSAQNIEFRTGSLGKIKVNDEDLSECVHQVQRNKDDIVGLKRNGIGLYQNVSNEVHRIHSQLVDLEEKFRRLQQTVDTNVCSSNPCRNGGTCLDLKGSFFCICPSQWKGPLCSDDVNECALYSGTLMGCQNGATCVNTMGSYRCDCSPETYGKQCELKYDDCKGVSKERCVHGICEDLDRVQNEQPKFSCICEAGWTSSPNSSACTEDINECLQSPCSELVTCINTQGSFYCGACPAGWQGNGYYCQDINECEVDNGGCSVAPLVECVNTLGSFRCGDCPPGYSGNGKVCSPINICLVNNGGCHPQASCSSSQGSIPLCTCLPGYTGNGYGPNGCIHLSGHCLSHPCLHGECAETVSGYFCKCIPGWTGVNCSENINECASNPCLNGGTCVDGLNSFSCMCTSSWTGDRCQTPQQVCGETLSEFNGTISYLGRDAQYVHVNCFWVIRTEVGKVLRITFTFFELEQVNNCPQEFLQIHDGDSSSAFPLRRLCGNQRPQDILSSDNALYILLSSDHLREGRGFTLRWDTEQPECGGTLSGTYGSIKSPGYPGNYPPGRDCVWRIITSPELLITFTFGTLSLENHEDCSKDYLEIWDGPLPQDPVIGKYCTTVSVPPLQTTGPFARIHFHSDSQISDQGFHITYLTSPSDLHCGGNYTNPQGEILLSDFSGPLAHDGQCVYVITLPQGEQIDLKFTHVELEGQNGCSHSYIEVRDDETLLGKVCGNETLAPIRSLTNKAWIRFKTDDSIQRASFRATYQTVCGGEFTGKGTIRSPFYPNVYPGERTCRWTIYQPQSQVVFLNFTDFNIGSSANCDTDYVEIGSSPTLASPKNIKYCGSDRPSFITSVYNVLYVTFVKSSFPENHGFMATFGSEDLACGKVLTEPEGNIASPGFPNVYPNGVNCTWHILVQPGHVIRLHFDTFQLEFHYNCTKDYLEIYDAGSETSLGRYCGKSIPPYLTSSTNSVMLRFVADSDLAYEGFIMSYITVNASAECSYDYTDDYGLITSPNYPNPYPNDWQCTYRITVGTNQQIALHFTNFSLEDGISGDCVDFLEIRDGGYEDSPVVGKFCGKNLPPIIISHSNKLLLKFKSDPIISDSGFSAYWDGSATGCGGNLTTSTGVFTSPNYPMPYYHSSECYWWLKASHGSPFLLQFQDFHLEYHQNCSLDYLAVYDGPSMSSHLLAQLCGENMPAPILSSGDNLFLKLRTDEGQQGRGFRIAYEQTCNNVVITNQTYGILESINYPYPYSSDQRCKWTIQATTGNTVNYTFLAFDMEYHENCSLEYLEVGPQVSRLLKVRSGEEKASQSPSYFSRDASLALSYAGASRPTLVEARSGEDIAVDHRIKSSKTPTGFHGNRYLCTLKKRLTFCALFDGPNQIGRYCGKEIPPTGSTTTSLLHVLFHTDGISQKEKGFQMQWSVHGCGGELSGATGTFSSPGYPHSYPSNKECIWYLTTEPGSSIQLTIHDMDLEFNKECRYDALEIFGGPDFHSPRIAKLCERTSNPLQVSSTGNRIAIRFSTNFMENRKGFNASWQAVPGGCGGIFHAPRGEIHSPNYPSYYRSNTDCSWVIQVEQHHRVLLNFTDTDLEPPDSCIMTYDGTNLRNTRLTRVCGREQPPLSVTSSGNTLLVRFQSGTSRASKGFRAQFQQVCGGYFLVDSSGTISSPFFPNTYPSNARCNWILQAQPPFNHITVSFIYFGLESSQNCTHDYLEIFDGNSNHAPFRGRYCGSSIPHPITSFGSALALRFVSDLGLNGDGFQLSYTPSTSACGGTLNMREGIFDSPGYPDVYPPNVECVWSIVSSPGNQLQLSFISFQLEDSRNCNKDFLEIREGNATGPLVGRFCGSSLPQNYSSITAHILWVRFVSDGSGSGTGFQAGFAKIFGNNNIVGSHGKIASPFWPGNYPHNSDYKWTVNVNTSQVIHGRILELDIESTQNCYYDFLRLYDGVDVHSRLLGTYCGSETGSFSTGRNSLTVYFHSDYSKSSKGFLLEWFAVDLPNGVLSTIAPGSCGGFMTTGDQPMIFFSPGWPENYDNYLDCTWVIQAPGSTVELNILSLDIEAHWTCAYDKLVIRDGANAMAPELATVCGKELPGPIRSTGDHMYIHFTSDYSGSGAGFNASFHKSCGGYLHADRGVITSPNYPDVYPPYLNCSWHVLVQTGLTIAVHFQQPFDIANGDSSSCNQGDYLVLKSGADISSPPLGVQGGHGRFCGSRPSSTLFTSDNQMFVQFISEHTQGGKGFKITYEAQGLACGGTIYIDDAESEGYVTSPNYPANYPQHTECIWILQAPPGSSIMLKFEDQFSIEGTSNCTSSYLEVRDGDGSNAPALAKLCGTSLPRKQLSSREMIYLRFQSDNSPTHVGFKAKYSIAQCGGTVAGQSGVIESPGYPTQPYPHNSFCQWHLQGLLGHYLTIQFQDLHLQNSSGCEKDFVEIWENNPASLLGRYCGNTIPRHVETFSNVAFVKFVTDDSVALSGFSLKFQSSIEMCGGEFHVPGGTFTSPNYPYFNHRGRLCEWRIIAEEGKRVTLTFNTLRLGMHPSCENEYLIVYNGIRSNSPQLEKLCSRVNTSTEFKSSGNTMKVVYFTDGTRSNGGFSASYTSSEAAVCGGSVSNVLGGNVTWPGFRTFTKYPKNLNCEWTISNPKLENSSIYIQVDYFFLDRHQNCVSDALEFRLGDADGPLIEQFCGPSVPVFPMVIPNPKVWLQFFTSEYHERSGFHLTYVFTDCGGIQTGESGVITSPNYPGPYKNSSHCAWLLEAPQGHTIILTFSDFDIEGHSHCAWDSVTVRNGGSPLSPIIGQYCGTSGPGTIHSGSNQLVVIFNSDHSVDGGGFYATWSTETLGCGGIIHSESGTMKSPHWPQNFPQNSQCSWTAITHESKHWEIHFDSNFRIPSSDAQCSHSFLKVWSGTQKTNDTLLSTLCGNEAPSPIILPTNTFTALFQSQEMPAQGFFASFVSRCGNNFTKPVGNILSPNFPKQYDNDMNCTYMLEGDAHSLISLTFVNFNLEARSAITGSCDNDGLHIIRGHSLSSTPVVTMCGSETSRPLTIVGPVLLNFYSNSHITDFGFKISYKINRCGGEFSSSSGTLKSPSYPRRYLDNLHCIYKITVGNDRIIQLKFSDFVVDPSAFCSQDYLGIYDGSDTSAPLLGKFCGYTPPENIKSSNNSLTLLFKTDSFHTARGWKVDFQQTLGPMHGCGGYLSGSQGSFATPDSDSNGRYDKGLNCIWVITAPDNKRINLTFTTFDLEDATIRGRCYDRVKIFDGENEHTDLAGTFCGSTAPAPFISSGKFLTVQFISDQSLEKIGFNVTYTFVDMPCGGTYNATWIPQSLSSPQLSSPSLPLSTCTWVIQAPPEQLVKITVADLKLHSQDCAQNYFELRALPQNNGNSRMRYCSTNASAVPAFYSSTSTAIVLFKSEVLDRDSEVRFIYQVADCSRDYNQAFGTLRSPGWPGHYPGNLDCTVTLTAPGDHNISLFFHTFALEDSNECTQDFLEVRDGGDNNSPLLGKYCGTLLPNPVFSQRNKLYLRFKSNSNISNRGYEILWTSSSSGCGGTLYEDSGLFTSPGFPNTYPNNSHCEWTIVAPSGRPITVNFDSISIDDPGNCVHNYLILYNGPNVNSPPFGPYCGADTSIAPFVASSSRVFIKFHAESVMHPSSFRLRWHS